MELDYNIIRGKKIFISGGTGSWGVELTRQLLDSYNPQLIVIYSRGELAQVQMARAFNYDKRLKFVIGDVRDQDSLIHATSGIDIIFHLAALKHVPICEENPWESVQTNIYGVKNIISSALTNKVELVIDISTDKACSPLNLYGACKSVGEKLIINANSSNSQTKFTCIRAGNVMGTNGSIIPYFEKLAKEKESIPITNIEMTRYFMTLHEAINLVFKATCSCHGGEIFVTKMPAAKIIDLSKVIWSHYNPTTEMKYHIVGIRPGEKIHEMLISEYESKYSVEDSDFGIILPMNGVLNEKYKNYKKMSNEKYDSNQNLLTLDEIKMRLNDGGFLK